jgi:hypothetical protein
MASGQDAGDRFWYAQTTAVYHPNPSPVLMTFEEEKDQENDDD